MKKKIFKNTGFSLVEILLALVITAMLMAAVAVAFNASITNYKQNQNIFNNINSARQALYRITTQIRTANAVDPNAPANECSFFTSDGNDITYRYDNTDCKLYLMTNNNPSDPNYLLCDNITAMSFTQDTDTDDQGDPYVKSVQISLTIGHGNIQQTLSAAAVIRRNLQQN